MSAILYLFMIKSHQPSPISLHKAQWPHGLSALDSVLSSVGSSPSWGHWVAFLVETFYSRNACLYRGVQMGTGEFNVGGNPAMD